MLKKENMKEFDLAYDSLILFVQKLRNLGSICLDFGSGIDE